MLIAVISDIHSNLPALEAVMDAVDRESPEEIHCLGDVVGYGADPGPCIDIVRRCAASVVLGNHDLAVADGTGIKLLPPHGRVAAEHNTGRLSSADRTWLAERPLKTSRENATFVHASPQNPDRWTRIESFPIARSQFDHFDTDVCFIGHSHVPAVLSDRVGVFNVRSGYRFLINAGSVGQPRDGDPRAAFGLFDTEAFRYRLRRVPYDVARAMKRIEEEGLPAQLGRRLEIGM